MDWTARGGVCWGWLAAEDVAQAMKSFHGRPIAATLKPKPSTNRRVVRRQMLTDNPD